MFGGGGFCLRLDLGFGPASRLARCLLHRMRGAAASLRASQGLQIGVLPPRTRAYDCIYDAVTLRRAAASLVHVTDSASTAFPADAVSQRKGSLDRVDRGIAGEGSIDTTASLLKSKLSRGQTLY